MRPIFALFLFATVNLTNAQNSYLYTTEGEKILIQDFESFGYFQGNIEYGRYKGENKGFWYKSISVKKIDSITVQGKITYRPLKLNGLKKTYLFRTLITSTDKDVLVAFMRFENDTRPVYYVVDKNLNLLEKDWVFFGRDSEAKFYALLRKYFPGCESMLESIKHYESLPRDYYKLEKIPGPEGFPYQNRVFDCN